MTRPDWLAHLARVGAGHGFLERIGERHLGLFVEEGDTLLISFDRAERVYGQSVNGLPAGFELVQRREWSYLSILSIGTTAFRDAELYAFFDRLIDDGVFDSFERVIFLGLGPANGHAACAYSAAAPGARVIASRPAARVSALDPHEDRYSDAAALLSICELALIMEDRTEPFGQANAARFQGPRVTQVNLPHSAPDLENIILDAGLTLPMCRALERQKLDAARLREILRPVLHSHGDYLMRLAEAARQGGHPRRAATVARSALAATDEARFDALLAELGALGDAPHGAAAAI